MMTDKDTISICSREIQNLNHGKSLTKNLFNMRESGSLCDITLRCNGSEIKAHRVVLAASSEYFLAMFTSGLCETTLNEISLKFVDTKALSVLVNYAYTGVLFVNEINVQTLLKTADQLQFNSAKSLCCEFITEQVSEENCLDMFQFADMYNCNDMLTLSQHVFNKHWKKIVNSESFLSLDFDVFVKLISDDFLNVGDESEVMAMITNWIEADQKSRRERLPYLIKHVRWPYVTPKKLSFITSIPLFKGEDTLLVEIDEQSKPIVLNCPKMRISYKEFMYVLGGERSFLKEMKSSEFFDYSTSSWTYGFPLKRPRTSFAAVCHGDKLFIIGGIYLGEKLRSVECYNEQEGNWKRLSSLKKCQGDVKAAVLDEVVYVAGGSSGGEPACRYVEKYDQSNNQWVAVAVMKSRRRRFGMCEYKSKLYVFGGFEDMSGDMNVCETYDPDANTWESISPMSMKKSDLGVAVLSECIYVVGGVNSRLGSVKSVDKYNPATDTWSTCRPMTHARGGHAMVSYFGRLIAIGGMNAYMRTCEDVEWYDEYTNKWFPLSVTDVPRCGSAAVVLPFCIRGTDEDREDPVPFI